MGFNIVLFEPEIPNNTGNIGRLALATNSVLHLVGPLGFELADSKLKRAGLDYWKYLSLQFYNNIEEFYSTNHSKNLIYLSSHATQSHYEISFEENMFLVFGKESQGLPKEIIERNHSNSFKIPMYSEKIRSLNLANAVSIVVYEGLRNLE
jgi:tRNA (cytidine/uridine-2'-O-)-methyltransferase